MPMQYNNAFHNSFYNTQLEKIMNFSKASKGSKRSLLFSPKTSLDDGKSQTTRGGTREVDIREEDRVMMAENEARAKIWLEQQMISDSKI